MRETYQKCNVCGSEDIDKQSGAMGIHTCNNCGSGSSISWREREVPEPCNHPGCEHHITHACEHCGGTGRKPMKNFYTAPWEDDEEI